MVKLFFLLSGEHKTLPASELMAILEAEGCAYKVSEQLDQALRLEADSSCVEHVKRRAAFTKICAMEMFSCKAETSEILKSSRLTEPSKVLRKNESFAVRIKRVKDYASEIDGMLFERKLGQVILNKTEGTRVDLKDPDKTLVGILTDRKFIFGLQLAEILPKRFMERRPKNKPFFHPSAMKAKLARCMVNLAKPQAGDLLLDPFCGTGSMLVEAALIGCRVVGFDIKRRMAKGALRNMVYFNISPEGILVADARNMPIRKIDQVVTDPPYGRSATTLKRTTKQIVEEGLMAVRDMLYKGKRVCMAAPKNLNIGGIGTALGYKHLESHFVYVHRSLTREITVFEKV